MAEINTIVLIVVFNLLSGAVALAVSYYAFQARKLVENSVLRAMGFGFMLLGAALIVETVTSLALGFTPAEVARAKAFDLLENLVYLVLQVVALSVIALSYARITYGKAGLGQTPAPAVLAATSTSTSTATAKAAAATGLTLVLYYLFLGIQLVVLLLLVFIVFQGYLVYTRSRNRSSLLVLLGFTLMFLAHIVVLNSILDISGAEYLVAACIQFFGFMSLLVFLVRSARIGPT